MLMKEGGAFTEPIAHTFIYVSFYRYIKKGCPLPGLGWVRRFIRKDMTLFLCIVHFVNKLSTSII